MIKTTGKDKDYELIEYILNVNTQYTQVLMELNENGAMDAAYTYGVSRLTEDRFTGESNFYLYDPAGNVAGITDQDGYLWQSYRYDAFGNATFGSPQYDNEYTFNAESYNPNIQSQYLRARYYDMVKGNFLTEDSYLGDIRNPLTLNRYSYCIGNPLFYDDPSGHWITWEEREELSKALPDKLPDDDSTYYDMTLHEAYYWASSYLGALHELDRKDATLHEVLGHAQRVEDIRALVKEAVKKSSAKDSCDVRKVLCLTQSDKIEQFIIECEGGFKDKMYDADPGNGDWTIGIGHKVSKEEYKKYKDKTISYEEGLELFNADMEKAVTGLADFLKKHHIQLKQNEFDAMVSFTFRYGENIWNDSRKPEDKGGSMLYFFKDGDYLKAKNPDAVYTEVEQIFAVYSGKGNAAGNRIRACEEEAMYLYGVYQRSGMEEKDLNDEEIIRQIEEYNKFHKGKEVEIVR